MSLTVFSLFGSIRNGSDQSSTSDRGPLAGSSGGKKRQKGVVQVNEVVSSFLSKVSLRRPFRPRISYITLVPTARGRKRYKIITLRSVFRTGVSFPLVIYFRTYAPPSRVSPVGFSQGCQGDCLPLPVTSRVVLQQIFRGGHLMFYEDPDSLKILKKIHPC